MHREDLTRCINREVPEAEAAEAEGARAALIRAAVLPTLAREPGGLQPPSDRPHLTQLVQEVWLKLERSRRWESRAQFLAAASRAARQVLVDEARTRARRIRARGLEHAGGAPSVESDPAAAAEMPARLDGLLRELGEDDPVAARVAGFRLFGGLPAEAIAEVEGISTRQVFRHWEFARAWLAERIRRGS